MPLWCWTHRASGFAWHCDEAVRVLDRRVVRLVRAACTPPACPGAADANSRRRPRVSQTPPQEMPTVTRRESRGSTQIEWMPGTSSPPPNQFLRSGRSQSGRFSSHVAPPSSELEQAARQGAAPERLRLVRSSGGEGPDLLHPPFDDLAVGVPVVETLGLGRIRGSGALLPGLAAVGRAVQLGAEMAEVQSRVDPAPAVVQHDGDRDRRGRPSG